MGIKRRFMIALTVLYIFFSVLVGCGGREDKEAASQSPIVITLWHSYNAVAKAEFDRLVREFNDTAGAEKGIIVDTIGYGTSDELEEVLYASANRMIGSKPLPDIFASYPDSAFRLDKIAPLAVLDNYFTTEELKKYQPEFLKEGVWSGSNTHKMIPVAKSTELLYLNQTAWQEFCSDTEASDNLLETWEGLMEVAGMYYEWSGGQPFLGMNSYSDFAVLTAAQLGEHLYQENVSGFSYGRDTARRAWDVYYEPHIKGWYESSVYNQDGIKSGKMIAYIGSSAGAGFFPKEVIVDEEHSYPVECVCLPYPTFRDGEKYMTQRGANMGVFESEKEREAAACEFLKWFTNPGQNTKFAISTGYLPVMKEAIESVPELLSHIDGTNNADAIKSSIYVFQEARGATPFYIQNVSDVSYKINKIFKNSLEKRTASALESIEIRIKSGENKEKIQAELLSDDQFNQWYDSLMREMAGVTDGEKDQK